ncbi:MAG: hypothetical protein ACK5AK_03055 [Gemmatimonas sp.]
MTAAMPAVGRMRRGASRPALTLAVVLLGGCASRSASTLSVTPVLASLAPSSADVSGGNVVVVTATGRGFDALNTVHFGRVRLMSVPRTSDSTVQFTVPTDDTFLVDRGATPVMPLPAGRYEVVIETARGKSNGMVFELRGGAVR